MKKQFSKVMAVSLICAMLVPNMAYASSANRPSIGVGDADLATGSDADGEVVEGDGKVDGATYRVMLPTDLNFAVDKFQIANKEQIYGADYPILNGSEFPVKVTVSVSNSSTDPDVVLVPKDDAKLSDEDTKAFYLTAVVAKTFEVKSGSILPDVGDPMKDIIGATPSEADDMVFPVPVGVDGAAEFTYALGKLEDYDDLKLEKKNCATFTFGGQVNPNIKWEDDQLKIKTVFKFKGLSQKGYQDATPDLDNNLIASGVDIESLTAFTVAKTDTALVIKIRPNSIKSIDKFVSTYSDLTFDAFAEGYPGTFNKATGEITIPVTGYYEWYGGVLPTVITYTDLSDVQQTKAITVTVTE